MSQTTGCIVNNDTNIYTNSIGIKNPYGGASNDHEDFNGTPLIVSNIQPAPCNQYVVVKNGVACYVYNFTGNNFVVQGQTATATIASYAIDKYVWFFIGLIGLLSLLLIENNWDFNFIDHAMTIFAFNLLNFI